jgi:hypothetical protein
MSFRVLLAVLLFQFSTGGSMVAQQLRDSSFPSYDPPPYFWQTERSSHAATTRDRAVSFAVQDRDYRWEGLVIGGLLLGATAAYVGNRLCNDDNIADKRCTGATVGGFFVGATVGVVTGGLIGSAIPKR